MAEAAPSSFSLIAWQWQATMVPLMDRQRDELFEVATRFATELRGRVSLSGFGVERNTDSGRPTLVMVNGGTRDPLRVEVTADHIGYRTERIPIRERARHLKEVAQPLLGYLLDAGAGERLLRSSLNYEVELQFPVADGRRPNLDAVLGRLTPGLGDRPWERSLRRPSLGRVDLTWGIEVKVAGAPATLWFDLDCPGNNDYTELSARIAVQSPSDTLPEAAWCAAVAKIDAQVWPVIDALFSTLGGGQQAHGKRTKAPVRGKKVARPRTR